MQHKITKSAQSSFFVDRSNSKTYSVLQNVLMMFIRSKSMWISILELVIGQEIGSEQCLQNDQFCVKWGMAAGGRKDGHAISRPRFALLCIAR